MQFAVLFSSLVAATIALPVPQTGVGSADALSGPTGGTESLFPGSANSVLSEGSKPVADLSNPSSGIVERSSGAGAGTGDVLSGVSGGTNTMMAGGANNALNSGGNSVSDLASSSGDLAGTGDLFSNTASGTNNALNNAGNSASDLSNSSGDLVSRSPEPAVGGWSS
ncbi:hypothetical protein MBLNU13_g10537t1 [Cladosporium sp. NU13]